MQEFQSVPSAEDFLKTSHPSSVWAFLLLVLVEFSIWNFVASWLACEDFPEVFREAGRSRLMAKVHRNTEGGILSFFTLELLAEMRELHRVPTSQTHPWLRFQCVPDSCQERSQTDLGACSW